jgi:ATP-dependent Clp protease ATP-binding subunit ClpC
MATVRFPVCLWQKGAHWVGRLIGSSLDANTVVADSPNQIVRQFRQTLKWYYHDCASWAGGSSFRNPVLRIETVSVQPAFEVEDRVYPMEHAIELRIASVAGEVGDTYVCAIPALDTEFYYYDEKSRAQLLGHHVQQSLNGREPAQIARMAAPPELRLEELAVVVTDSKEKKEATWRQQAKTLGPVASPIGDAATRRGLSRAWGRDYDVERLRNHLLNTRSNILLVGERGVGKTCLLVDAVRKVESKSERRFWQTSAGRIIAGMMYLGQWEARVETVIESLAQFNGVLCFESLLELLRTGGREASDSVGAFLASFLDNGALRAVAECTPVELETCRRLLPNLVDLFQIVSVECFSEEAASSVLEKVSKLAERDQKVRSSAGACAAMLSLFGRYLPYRSFPGSVCGFQRALIEQAIENGQDRIGTDEVVEAFSERTGLPPRFLRDTEPMHLDRVTCELRKSVVGQEAACDALGRCITTFKAGLNDPKRPLGVFLFAGPTGVGKTQLAKTVADHLFGARKGDRLVRLDMSEYAGPGAGERFFLGEDGKPSAFIQTIREHPFSVVLFDEIEKASSAMHDMLLNLLDEGYVTDRWGRVTWFRSAILIMTTNVGAKTRSAVRFEERTERPSEVDLMNAFRPEFINRIDQVVHFHALGIEPARAIVALELAEIAKREGMAACGHSLKWAGDAVDWLVEVGLDPKYGARPLQRAIEQQVIVPLSFALLEVNEAGQHFVLRRSEDGLTVST